MQYIGSLDLADPRHVILPKPHEDPVPFLPIENGFACNFNGCDHLCVTIKRMKSHWATVHNGVAAVTNRWRPVCLQTFFRGNQLRYFIVSGGAKSDRILQLSSDADTEILSLEVDMLDAPPIYYPGWNAEDLELLQHFKSSTCLYLGNTPQSIECWQTIVPQLASNHCFLKHGILACTAMHRAHQIPAERQRYQFIAAYHQNIALPEFRSLIGNVTERTCSALLAFSYLLILNTIASDDQDENLLLVGGKNEASLPDWLQVIRGSCSLFGNCCKIILNGPISPLATEATAGHSPTPEPEEPESEDAVRLDLLFRVPFLGQSSIAKRIAEVKPSPFPGALMKLQEAFSKIQVARSVSKCTLWTVIYAWPAQVSQDYLDLLKDRDPPALILLAHYCILLEPLESTWYMHGFRKRLLSRIYHQLDPEWQKWLQWPVEEIGLQEQCST